MSRPTLKSIVPPQPAAPVKPAIAKGLATDASSSTAEVAPIDVTNTRLKDLARQNPPAPEWLQGDEPKPF